MIDMDSLYVLYDWIETNEMCKVANPKTIFIGVDYV